MKTRKFLSNELLASIDVLNTLSGGVSEPIIKRKQFEDHRELKLKVPGVSEEALKVEIHNNILSVFYTFSLQSDELSIDMPRVVYNKPIPYFACLDVTRITGQTFGAGYLFVILPFNALAKGYHRTVSTKN